jgi:hypothetical protein
MDSNFLEAIGEALYGGQWRDRLASELGYTVRQLYRWRTGEYRVNEEKAIPRLLDLLRGRVMVLEGMIAALERLEPSMEITSPKPARVANRKKRAPVRRKQTRKSAGRELYT